MHSRIFDHLNHFLYNIIGYGALVLMIFGNFALVWSQGSLTHCTCSDAEVRAENNSMIASLLLDGYRSVHKLAAKTNLLSNQLQFINNVVCKSLDGDLGTTTRPSTIIESLHLNNDSNDAEVIALQLERSSCFLLRYFNQISNDIFALSWLPHLDTN